MGRVEAPVRIDNVLSLHLRTAFPRVDSQHSSDV